MKKASLGRTSRAPIRLSNRASTLVGNGPADVRTSSSRSSTESRLKSHIPLLKARGSSCDRESRSRMKTIDPSGNNKRSVSHATPKTPLMHHLEVPTYMFNSAQSTRSRSGSRCSSAERVFKLHKGKLTDTRPIKDHSFQYRAMCRVYDYFQTQSQPVRDLCPVPQTRSIMIQSFVDMMGHLLHHFFSNHGVYKKNYTEEIPKLMKKLYYPGNISTSWLKTVNAPHAWPHVVAALSWLVDLIVQRESQSIGDFFPQALNEEEAQFDQKMVFKSMLDSFEAWNKGDDGKCEAFDLALWEAMTAAQGFSDDDLERLAKDNKHLSEQLDDPIEQRAAQKHESLVDTVRSLASKEKGLLYACQEMENTIDDMESKLADCQDQCNKLEQGIESITIKRDHLAQVVATQTMSISDAKAIKEEINNIEREIKNNNAYLAQYEKIRGADDIKMAFLKQKLNDMCVQFNNEILQSNVTEFEQLKVQTNLNFFERDLDAARSEMARIVERLEQLKSNLVKKHKLLDCSLENHDEMLKESKAERKRTRDKIKALEEERMVNERELQALEAMIEKRQSEFKAEYDLITAKNIQLVKSSPDINGITDELNRSRAMETEGQQKMEEMVKIVADFLCHEAQAVDCYKREVLSLASQTK